MSFTELQRVADRSSSWQQLAGSDAATEAAETAAAVGAERAVTKDVRDIWKALRAAVCVVAPAREQRRARRAAVGGLHLHERAVLSEDPIRQQHAHRRVVHLARLRAVAVGRGRPVRREVNVRGDAAIRCGFRRIALGDGTLVLTAVPVSGVYPRCQRIALARQHQKIFVVVERIGRSARRGATGAVGAIEEMGVHELHHGHATATDRLNQMSQR